MSESDKNRCDLVTISNGRRLTALSNTCYIGMTRVKAVGGYFSRELPEQVVGALRVLCRVGALSLCSWCFEVCAEDVC